MKKTLISLVVLFVFVFASGCKQKTAAAPTDSSPKNPTFLKQLGTEGTASGQFVSPCAVAIDANDNVFVLDGVGDHFLKFDNASLFINYPDRQLS